MTSINREKNLKKKDGETKEKEKDSGILKILSENFLFFFSKISFKKKKL